MSDDSRSPDRPEPRPDEATPDPLAKLREGGHGGNVGGAGQYAGLGLQFAISILVFLYLGNWVDGRLGSGPLFLILGVFLGAGAAFYSIYRTVMAGSGKGTRRKTNRDKKDT